MVSVGVALVFLVVPPLLATAGDEATAPGPGQDQHVRPMTRASWRTHPKVVAVRGVVQHVDSALRPASRTWSCLARWPETVSPDTEAAPKAVVYLHERSVSRAKDATAERVAVRRRVIDWTGPDFPGVFDYVYTRYRVGARDVFFFIQGTDRQIGFFSREVRTYYEDGRPIWFVAQTMNGHNHALLQELSGARAAAQKDLADFTPMAEIVIEPAALDDAAAWFVGLAGDKGMPCTASEAEQLSAIAESGASTTSQRKLVERFTAPPRP